MVLGDRYPSFQHRGQNAVDAWVDLQNLSIKVHYQHVLYVEAHFYGKTCKSMGQMLHVFGR